MKRGENFVAIAYSQDLRIRALELLKTGMSIQQVSRLLNISRPTLYRWIYQLETTGSTAPKKRIPPPQRGKIQDWQKFPEFITLHGDKTQKELAKLWGNVSHHTISRGLIKLGYTRKKKLMVTKNAVKKPDKNLEKK
ncbi:MAG: helix-turn-helix domain-containing protein [Moorea sp. SIO2B7]|nr:helix-turn-helix domain-containing protein [Moorena sp. SIO2B7]